MSNPAAFAARSTMAWKPRFENGALRSLTNTKGDLDFCSRCSRRSARSARPVSGCVAGVPKTLGFETPADRLQAVLQ